MTISLFSIVLVSCGGLLLGYLAASLLARKREQVLGEELLQARSAHEQATQERKLAADADQARIEELEQQLLQAMTDCANLEQQSQGAQSQLQEISHSYQNLQAHSAESEKKAESFAMARRQAEQRYKQAEGHIAQLQKQIQEIEAILSQTRSEHSSSLQALEIHKDELVNLRGELESMRVDSMARAESSLEAFAANDGRLEKVLQILLESEQQQAVVLADINGIVIAAAGDKNLRDGLAVTTQLIETTIRQLEGMVPFEEMQSFLLRDNNSSVIAGRTFSCGQEHIGIATYGSKAPPDQVIDGAVANVTALLE